MFAYDMGKASMSTPPSMLQTAAGNPKVYTSVIGNSEYIAWPYALRLKL